MNKKNKMLSVMVLSLAVILLSYSFYYGADNTNPLIKDNRADGNMNPSNSTINNNLSNTNSNNDNVILISLEKPPDKAIGG